MCKASKRNINAYRIHVPFNVNCHGEKEARMTPRPRSVGIALGWHALTSLPKLMPQSHCADLASRLAPTLKSALVGVQSA